MIPIAASSICWHRDSLEDAMRKAREAGFEAFEPLTFPSEIFRLHGDLRELKASEMGKLLEHHDLKLAALHRRPERL